MGMVRVSFLCLSDVEGSFFSDALSTLLGSETGLSKSCLTLWGQTAVDQTSTGIQRKLLTILVLLKRKHAIRKIDATREVRNREVCVSGRGQGDC